MKNIIISIVVCIIVSSSCLYATDNTRHDSEFVFLDEFDLDLFVVPVTDTTGVGVYSRELPKITENCIYYKRDGHLYRYGFISDEVTDMSCDDLEITESWINTEIFEIFRQLKIINVDSKETLSWNDSLLFFEE